MSELTCTGDTWGLLKWKAERSEHRAIGKKQRDTPNWPILANAISRALCTKGLRSDLLAWPRIWSVSGVSELVGASYTENRKACRSRLIFVDVGLGPELSDRSSLQAVVDLHAIGKAARVCFVRRVAKAMPAAVVGRVSSMAIARLSSVSLPAAV